jgi:hypothetical protein
MAPRTRLASTLDPAKVEHAGVAVGSGRSLTQSRLVVTADAVDAATSASAAATSAAAAATSAAAAATQAANALTSAGNADTSEAAALASQIAAASSAAAAAASEAATAAAVAAEATLRANADTALQNNINLKANIASPTFTGTVSGVTKSMVGLGNVDNTSDANKPVSTAQATADGLRALKAGDTFTGDLTIDKGVPRITFHDSAATANTRRFAPYAETNAFGIAAYNDANVWQRALITLPHAGGVIPTHWATVNRPASPGNGTIGYNVDTNQIEFYKNGWHTLESNLGTLLKWNDVAAATATVDIVWPSGARGIRVSGSWCPTTNGQFLCMHTSHDSGSSWSNAAGNYGWGHWVDVGTSRTGLANADYSYCQIGGQPSNTDLQAFEVVVVSTDGTGYTSFWGRSTGYDGTNSVNYTSAGFRKSTTAVNGVRLLPASGTMRDMRYVVEYF